MALNVRADSPQDGQDVPRPKRFPGAARSASVRIQRVLDGHIDGENSTDQYRGEYHEGGTTDERTYGMGSVPGETHYPADRGGNHRDADWLYGSD